MSRHRHPILTTVIGFSLLLTPGCTDRDRASELWDMKMSAVSEYQRLARLSEDYVRKHPHLSPAEGNVLNAWRSKMVELQGQIDSIDAELRRTE